MSTVRDALVDALRAVVGSDRDVHVVPYQDNMDVPDRPAVMFKQMSIRPLPAGPRAGLQIDYVLTFIAPETDPAKAETFLDTWVPETLADMSMFWFVWTDAQKVVYGDLNPAYDVSCYVLATPTNNPLPATAPAPEPLLTRGNEND